VSDGDSSNEIRQRMARQYCGAVGNRPTRAGGGSPTVRYSVGYGSYYGAHPWGYYPGRPVYVGGGGGYDIPDIPDIPEGPVAEPMPDFGMPEPAIAAFDF